MMFTIPMELMRINYSRKNIINNFIINVCIVLSIVLCACGKTHNAEYEYRMRRAIEDYQYIYWVAPQSTDDLIEWIEFQRDDESLKKVDPHGNDFLTWLRENRSNFSIEITDSTIVWSSETLGYCAQEDRRSICELLYAERRPRNEIQPCAIETKHRLAELEPSLDESVWQHQQQLNSLIREQSNKELGKTIVRRAYQYECAANVLSDFCTGEAISGEEYHLIIPFVEQILLKNNNISTLRFTMYIPNSTIAD